MPQIRDPFVNQIAEELGPPGEYLLIEPKAAQPTRAGGGIQTVKHIERVCLCDETNDGAIVDVGLMIGAHIFWVWTMTLTTATYWYWAHFEVTTLSDYQVVARFHVEERQCAEEGDLVRMNVFGYYLEPYTSP